MRIDRKLLSFVLALCMLLGLAPHSLAASRSEKTYQTIGTTVYQYGRRFLMYDGLVPACDFSGAWGVINSRSETVIPFEYNSIQPIGFDGNGASKGSQGYFLANTMDGLWVLLNSKGEIALTFADTFRCVGDETEYGFVVKDETESGAYTSSYYTWDLIPCTKDEIDPHPDYDSWWKCFMSDEVVYYEVGKYDADGDKKYGLLDENMNIVFPVQYDSISQIDNDVFALWTNSSYTIKKTNGQVLIPEVDVSGVTMSFGRLNPEGYISVYSYTDSWDDNTFTTKIYKDGALVKTFNGILGETLPDTGLLLYRTVSSRYGTKYGVMDVEGTSVIPTEYKYIQYTNNGRFILSDENWKEGIVDANGRIIVPMQYDYIEHCKGDQYILHSGDSCALVDPNGRVIVSDQNSISSIWVQGAGYIYDLYSIRNEQSNTIKIVDGNSRELATASSEVELTWGWCPLSDQYDPASKVGRLLAPSSSRKESDLVSINCVEGNNHTTLYIDAATGEIRAEFPFWASAPTTDGCFIYRADDGGVGLGHLEDSVFETVTAEILMTSEPASPLAEEHTIPTATQYVPYRASIPSTQAGGSFSLTSGSLPAGLRLSADGVLSGFPTELGVFSFTVTESYEGGSTEHKCTLSVYSRMYADVEENNIPGYGFVETETDDGRVQDQVVSSVEELTDQVMHCEGPYSQFRNLYLDARKLIRDVEYTAEEGSTKITIYAETIGEEGGGTHTLAAEFETDDGETVYTVQNYTVAGIASTEVHVTVSGETVIWTDAEPYIDTNSRTMTPFRVVGDALGLTIAWDSATREASFSNGAKTIWFPIGSTAARTSEGQTVEMDTSAVIVNGRTYAPVRYLAEYFGYGVGWEHLTRTVVIE